MLLVALMICSSDEDESLEIFSCARVLCSRQRSQFSGCRSSEYRLNEPSCLSQEEPVNLTTNLIDNDNGRGKETHTVNSKW